MSMFWSTYTYRVCTAMYLDRKRGRERARVNSSVESQIRQDKKCKSPITQACAVW